MKGGGTTVQQIPVATSNIPSDPQSGFINELSVAIKRIEDRLAGPAKTTTTRDTTTFRSIMKSMFGGMWSNLSPRTRTLAIARWEQGDPVSRSDLRDIFGSKWVNLPDWQRLAILNALQQEQAQQIALGNITPPISATP